MPLPFMTFFLIIPVRLQSTALNYLVNMIHIMDNFIFFQEIQVVVYVASSIVKVAIVYAHEQYPVGTIHGDVGT